MREFSERYIARYEAIRAPATVRALKWRLVRPLKEFGDTPLEELRVGEIAAWEASLPPRFRHDVMRAFRMLGKAAVEWGFVATNPVATGPNPAPAVLEREILTPAEVDALAEEMEPQYGAAVLVGAWCYLRPSELLGLERRDLDLEAGLLHVRGTKTARSRRSVPVPLRARQALEGLPARIDTRLLFPAPSGGVYRLDNFRPPRVRLGRRCPGATGIDDAVHAPAQRPLVGARRGHSRCRRRALRRHIDGDARAHLPPPAHVERGERASTDGWVLSVDHGGRCSGFGDTRISLAERRRQAMRVPSKNVLALLLAGVFIVGGAAYATFPGAQEAKGDSASPLRAAQVVGPARGYARVSFDGTLAARSNGVVGVRRAVDSNSRRLIIFGAYCFNLNFSPVVLIGSPVPDGDDAGSRALSVSATTNVSGTLTLDIGRPIECPAGFRDAAIVVRSSGNRLSMSTAGVFVLFF